MTIPPFDFWKNGKSVELEKCVEPNVSEGYGEICVGEWLIIIGMILINYDAHDTGNERRFVGEGIGVTMS